MKFRLILLITLLAAFSSAFAQDGESSFLTIGQTVSPLNFRINESLKANAGPYAIYLNNISFNIRQDHSNPSNYVVSLNPLIWGVECGLAAAFLDTASYDWNDFIPLTFMIASTFTNLKFDIYWVHFGWDTDFYIYEKKLRTVFEITLGLRYEYKKAAFALNVRGPMPEQKLYGFMSPREKYDGLASLEFSYNLGENKITDFIFYRRPSPVKKLNNSNNEM